MSGRIIEATFLLVMIFLIISNADKFSTAIKAAGEVYSRAVETLQGR